MLFLATGLQVLFLSCKYMLSLCKWSLFNLFRNGNRPREKNSLNHHVIYKSTCGRTFFALRTVERVWKSRTCVEWMTPEQNGNVLKEQVVEKGPSESKGYLYVSNYKCIFILQLYLLFCLWKSFIKIMLQPGSALQPATHASEAFIHLNCIGEPWIMTKLLSAGSSPSI